MEKKLMIIILLDVPEYTNGLDRLCKVYLQPFSLHQLHSHTKFPKDDVL